MKRFAAVGLMAATATAHAQAPAPDEATLSVRAAGNERARVSIDGIESGDLPRTTRVAAGRHRIEVSGETGDAPAFELEVAPGDRLEVVVELEARTVPLVVTTESTTAHVFLDGADTGVAGRFEGQLPAGAHVLELRDGAAVKLRRPIVLTRGEPRALVLALPTAAAPPSGTAAGPHEGETDQAGKAARGGYIGLSPTIGMGLSGQVRVGCSPPASCTGTAPIQFGAALQTGYGFGVLGVELTLAGAYEGETRTRRFRGDGTGASLASDATVARLETFDYTSGTGFGGLGLRLRLGDTLARFTGGLSLGALFRAQSLERTLTEGVVDRFVRGFSGVGPAARVDVGLLLGERGGFSGLVALWTMVDAPSTDARSPAEPNDAVTSAPEGIAPRYRTPAYVLNEGFRIAAGLSLGGIYGL